MRSPLLYRRRSRTGYCAGVLLLALGLRLASAPALAAQARETVLRALGSETVLRAVLWLEGGITDPFPTETAPTETAPTETTAAPPETGTAVPALVPALPAERFTETELGGLRLRGNCTYEVDKAALLRAPLDWPAAAGPRVLIIQSHSSESYTPSAGYEYEPSANYRTLDPARSVIAVGDALAEALGDLGVEVIHDRTCCDYPSYNRSYANAREKIEAYLEEYPSLVMVVDVHRDALATPVRETAQVDGTVCAPLMLVIGTDEGGLSHPRWRDNLSAGLKLQVLLSRTAPGLAKDPSLRKERFNGDLTPGSLIVEVGSTENTLPEALASMPYLARAIKLLLEEP